MFIAIEMNELGLVNDEGSIEDTPEKAWERVRDGFHAPSTIIFELKPAFRIKEQKPKFIPISK